MAITEKELIMAKVISRPSGYAKFRLGMKNLHPVQEEVLDTLFDKPKNKVCFRCGNEVGKSSIVAVTTILFSIEMLNATVISTSATHRQIVKQLIPYLKQYSYLFPTWEFLDNCIKVNGETRYIGFATSNEGTAQGWHEQPGRPLVCIVDEAAGVEDSIFMAISRCNPTYLIIMGSPLSPEGFFYSACTEPNTMKPFKHFKLTKKQCLKKDGWWLNEQDIDDFINAWGADHPLVLSSIYAEFASNIENGLITLKELDKCYEFPPKHLGVEIHIGIDVAAGGDANVIALRIGNKINIVDEWKEQEVMRACDKIAGHLNDLKNKHNVNQSQVSLDADGMGIGFISRLKDLGWSVNEYHGGKTPENNQYASHIAEAWMEGIRKIKNCSVILPDNQDFKLQILSRKQVFNDKGKLKLESKADMKARGIKSPDIGDAVFIAMSNPSSGTTKFVKNIMPRAVEYRGYF